MRKKRSLAIGVVLFSLLLGGSGFGFGTPAALAESGGAGVCPVTIYPGGAGFEADGGAGSFYVTAASDCAWTAVSRAHYIAIAPGSEKGVGSGTVTFTVQANLEQQARGGLITVNSQNFTMGQCGTSCTIDTYQYFAAAGGSGQVMVHTDWFDCPWEAKSDSPWITINSGGSNTKTDILTFTVAPNKDLRARLGSILVGGKSVRISQDAGSDVSNGARIEVNPGTIDFGFTGATSRYSRTLYIRNAGTSDLVIEKIGIESGSLGSSFAWINRYCHTISPSASCPITVTYTPYGFAKSTGVLTIYSNDAATPALEINLSGGL